MVSWQIAEHSRFKKICLMLAALIFFLFTYFQLNDLQQYGNHDAWIWVLMYLFAALLNLFYIKYWVTPVVFSGWLGFSAGALLFRLQDDQGNIHFSRLHPANYWDTSGTHMIQNSNESGGLLILVFWALILWIWAKR
ncbi:transmembrane 220 family protein [Catenovulum sediminis]|uniref:Transmembrane 220 family protein n=1 Tax=Catenovulum sediminis TaxID=1740262 RepID=A0ABV1RMG4_9ALTE|nr:transmembrane 220 family protein [Catenovulum sediminis]